MKNLNPILISGKEVLPLVEVGKGINASDGRSSGAWAHENCVGTFSGVSPDFYDEKGNVVSEIFFKKSRPERHEEMVERAIKGGIAQAEVAHEVSNGNGRIHMNMLWELADSQRILEGVLEKAKGLIMSEQGKTEQEAYDYIRALSQAKHLSMYRIVEFIMMQKDG